MSGDAHLFTPWREEAEALDTRHVGREDLDTIFDRGLAALQRGTSPKPLLLFGPRGMGKSHLLARLTQKARGMTLSGLRLACVPEDQPPAATAAALWAMVEQGADDRPAWERWGASRPPPIPEAAPTLVIFDGLGRQLSSLPEAELRALRELLGARSNTWLVGTSVDLPAALTRHDSAFYGGFSPQPLEPLDAAQASALLDRAGPQPAGRDWPARREVLLTLAGGSPRALVALGAAARREPKRLAADDLLAVVEQLTAHYQLRFYDLGAKAQRIVSLLAAAPRELGPGEIADALGETANAISTEVSRMVEQGVLHRRPSGRQSWLSIPEPLFRFWLEYRTAPWSEARVAWVGKLLQATLSPEQLADRWLREGGERDEALDRLVREDGVVREEAVSQVFRELGASLRAEKVEDVLSTLQAAKRLGLGATARDAIVGRLATTAVSTLGDWLNRSELDTAAEALATPLGRWMLVAARVARTWRAGREVARARDQLIDGWPHDDGVPLQGTDRKLIKRLAEGLLMGLSDRPNPQGRPWVLTAERQRKLATIPFLRAHFLLRGRDEDHAPLISPDLLLDLTPQALEADAGELVCVAGTLNHAGLAAVALRAAERRPPMVFPECPHKERPYPFEVDRLLDLVWGGAWLWNRSATWFASLATASPACLERTLARPGLRALIHKPELDFWTQTPTALLALRRLAPDRFAALGAALDPSWAPALNRADALARSLDAHGSARLHPELERLRAALDA